MVTNDSAWYYVISINGDPQPLSLAINFAQLGLPAGSRYFATEVSAARFGAQCLRTARLPCRARDGEQDGLRCRLLCIGCMRVRPHSLVRSVVHGKAIIWSRGAVRDDAAGCVIL